jgi:branched-subunit amino acid ABC-type transport system permease component
VKSLVQALVSGLLIGGIYALIALGLNIVFGTMRVVNFAQGTLLMAAMFMAYWLYELGGLHPTGRPSSPFRCSSWPVTRSSAPSCRPCSRATARGSR